MAEDLPLLTDKNGAASSNVKMREIFREGNVLLPMAEHEDYHDNKTNKYVSKYKEFCQQESVSRDEYAKRLARGPLSNIYELQQKTWPVDEPWRLEERTRKEDLRPAIQLDACRDEKIWVENILRSSGDVSAASQQTTPVYMSLPAVDMMSDYSISIGEKIPQPQRETLSTELSSELQFTHLVCIPLHLSFVNFKVGQLYTQSLRLFNTSKSEVRISIKPPAALELDVELCSRLVITPGSAAIVKVHFRPKDVHTLHDELLIRVSDGQDLRVPITCYLEPPILNVLISEVSATRSCRSDVLDLGTRLLGDTHRVSLLFKSDAKHAEFIVLSEDSWTDYSIDIEINPQGKTSVITGCFSISPVFWAGGGTVPGVVICYAPTAGLHTAALRIISSTAIVRSLNLVADILMFNPDHMKIQADERDYDILCDEKDPVCKYYVNLGTSFPCGTLSKTIKIFNVSPIAYDYCWRLRRWNICRCSDDMEAKINEGNVEIKPSESVYSTWSSFKVMPAQGKLLPKSCFTTDVQLSNVGTTLGVQKAVLMLILKNIPVESLPPHIMITNKRFVEEEAILGLSPKRLREVCDVVCSQMEVWWEVVPAAYVLHPPRIFLRHSQRLESIPITLEAIKLYGTEEIRATWDTPLLISPPQCLVSKTTPITITLPFKDLSDRNIKDIDMRLTSEDKSCTASTRIERHCDVQDPALTPNYIWVGAVPPKGAVAAELTIRNDTNQHMYWQGSTFECLRDNENINIRNDRSPCRVCRIQSCMCRLLQPSRGALDSSEQSTIYYNCDAPKEEGCMATLIQVRRTDVGTTDSTAGTNGRAALIAYRVLAPRLVLRVLPCREDRNRASYDLDEDILGEGSAVLRPSCALTVGHRSCYRLCITNITPVPTAVRWEQPLDKNEALNVTFTPNALEVNGYATVEIMITLEAIKVCGRSIFVRRADVQHSSSPLYLLIDAAVSGIEVYIEVPVGGDNDSTAVIRITQNEDQSREDCKHTSSSKTLSEEFRKRNARNLCEPSLQKPVCFCLNETNIQERETYSLQFIRVPLRAVKSKTLVIRNVSQLDARWRITVRRWPRRHTKSLSKDQWAGDVRDPGVVIQCAPKSGVLRGHQRAEIVVSVYADSWGVYHDQILLEIENLEPVVLNVWIEVVGAPLQFALRPKDNLPPTLWLSSSDPERDVCATNTFRSDLNIHAFIVKEYEFSQNELPFRLYIRIFDVPPTCPCVYAYSDGTSSSRSPLQRNVGVELFLAPDYGVQDESCYRVEREEMLLTRGLSTKWNVTLLETRGLVPPSLLLLRCTPVTSYGEGWYRNSPPVQLVKLSAAERTPQLKVSRSEVRIMVCALDLPADDIVRLRKRFYIKNTGNGVLTTIVRTEDPWRVREKRDIASCIKKDDRHVIEVNLPPNRRTELCVEVSLKTKEVLPEPGEQYTTYLVSTTPLYFVDAEGSLIQSIPLTLEIDRPVLLVEPNEVDFGYVSDGFAKKSYCTVKRTSHSKTIDLMVQWFGDNQFRFWPKTFSLQPGESGIIYLQYVSKWRNDDIAEGVLRVYAAGAEWCAGSVFARAHATRQTARSAAYDHSDHTDDTMLLPPLL